MKTNLTIALLAVCGVLALSAGCGKKEAAAPPSAGETPTPAPATAATPQADQGAATQAAQAVDTQKQAEADKLAAAKAAAEKTAADQLAQTAAAQETARIQGLIDSAKSLTGQNKYAEALKILAELANLKLTPEQQALVDSLKKTAEQQAAQAVTDKAAAGASKAVGDALGGRK